MAVLLPTPTAAIRHLATIDRIDSIPNSPDAYGIIRGYCSYGVPSSLVMPSGGREKDLRS